MSNIAFKLFAGRFLVLHHARTWTMLYFDAFTLTLYDFHVLQLTLVETDFTLCHLLTLLETA